jgi:glycosyltransferase involved in cell wall biosynthesis
MAVNKRIVVISDFDTNGSGYKNLCIPLLTGLANLGYEIKVAGLGYQGTEHNHPFSIIPSTTLQDAHAVANNLCYVWQPDIIIVAMDIPLQEFFYNNLRQILKRTPQEVAQGFTADRKYIAITPLENGPLTMSWAAILLNMDAVFFISELGKQEALKAGLRNVEHLIVGVDTVFWHPATPDEKSKLRKGLGIGEDEFVVLTVADNQERKNLSAGIESIALLKKQTDKKVRYVLVTRPDSPVGWRINDYSIELGLTKEMMVFNRGLPALDLWGLYAVADVYLSTSKAEGLGMPVLEAMACKVPCVATDTGALTEVLGGERGHLVPAIYTARDVWGNELRHYIDTKEVVKELQTILDTNCVHTEKALEYIKTRNWDFSINQIDQKIKELLP